MDLKVVQIEKPEDVNVIIGQAHFIKTVEDLHEVMAGACPAARFGIAFCESSGPALVRYSGNDDELIGLAKSSAFALAAGHVFLIFMRQAFPINVLNAVKAVPEVASIYCATANPVEVILAETDAGRGVLGVIDGVRSKGIEGPEEQRQRHDLLRKFGYKL